MDPKRILLVTQLFPPEIGAGPTRMLEFQKGLISRGYDVTVLTALPNYPHGEIYPEYKGIKESWDEKAKILRTHIRPFKKKSTLYRIVTYLSFFNSAPRGDKKYFDKGAFDIVITSSPPIFAGLAGCNIAKRHNAKLIFDIRDVWPDIGVSMGLFTQNSLPYKWLDYLNNQILKSCNRILVTTFTDKKTINNKGFPLDNIINIPNGASLKTFIAIENNIRQTKREKIGLNDKFVICYSGSFNQGMNDVQAFVPLMQKLKDEKDIILLLIGDGENLSEIREKVTEAKLDNIIFMPHQELDQLNISLNLTDMGIIPRKKLLNGSSGGLPVKMFECWALKKPVLLASDPGTEERELLESIGGGVAVSPGDIDAMAEKIIAFRDNTDLRNQTGENGRKAVVENFSREAGLNKLVETIEGL